MTPSRSLTVWKCECRQWWEINPDEGSRCLSCQKDIKAVEVIPRSLHDAEVKRLREALDEVATYAVQHPDNKELTNWVIERARAALSANRAFPEGGSDG